MLQIERETLEELRDAVKDSAERVAAITGSRVQVVAAIKRAADDLQDEVTRIIVTARDNAASAAYTRVVIEARILGIDEPEDPDDDPEDEVRAHAVAASLIAALIAVWLMSRDARKATALQDFRLRRIAATEVAQSYNQALLRTYEKITAPRIGKRWDATLDSRVCQFCASMHGTVVPLNKPFPDNVEPGDVHVNCRCVLELCRL